MGYKISAKIVNPSTARPPDEVNLVSFGFRKGEEILEYKPRDVMTILNTLRDKYNGLMKKVPRERKPMTFSWMPLSDKTVFFPNYGRASLRFELSIQDLDSKLSTWNFVFDKVVLSPKTKEERIFQPGNYKRIDERFDGTFITFTDDR